MDSKKINQIEKAMDAGRQKQHKWEVKWKFLQT